MTCSVIIATTMGITFIQTSVPRSRTSIETDCEASLKRHRLTNQVRIAYAAYSISAMAEALANSQGLKPVKTPGYLRWPLRGPFKTLEGRPVRPGIPLLARGCAATWSEIRLSIAAPRTCAGPAFLAFRAACRFEFEYVHFGDTRPQAIFW